jgi:hypothetical protein
MLPNGQHGGQSQMTKLLLIAGFVLALSTLGFAAANAGPTDLSLQTPGGQLLDVSYD